jgi:hypothetical protein
VAHEVVFVLCLPGRSLPRNVHCNWSLKTQMERTSVHMFGQRYDIFSTLNERRFQYRNRSRSESSPWRPHRIRRTANHVQVRRVQPLVDYPNYSYDIQRNNNTTPRSAPAQFCGAIYINLSIIVYRNLLFMLSYS